MLFRRPPTAVIFWSKTRAFSATASASAATFSGSSSSSFVRRLWRSAVSSSGLSSKAARSWLIGFGIVMVRGVVDCIVRLAGTAVWRKVPRAVREYPACHREERSPIFDEFGDLVGRTKAPSATRLPGSARNDWGRLRRRDCHYGMRRVATRNAHLIVADDRSSFPHTAGSGRIAAVAYGLHRRNRP